MSFHDQSRASTLRRAVAKPEPIAFVILTLAVLGFYWLVRAPLLNPSNYIDPWIYTATFTNYHFLHTTFPSAYYPTRLPWIIPGVAVNSVFPPLAAFFVLHLVYFLAGGLFAFLLLRRFFASTAAFLGYVVLMFSPLFYNAYTTDYPDGALLTYLLGGAYFALTGLGSPRRALRLALGGFFLAAAVGTNLLTGAWVVGLTFVYLAVFSAQLGFLRAFVRDAAAFAAGAIVLLVGCGVFSRANGGEFLFFMPSVRAIGTLNSADYKAAGYGWLKGEPQLLLPLFALAALAVLVPFQSIRSWRTDARVRFAIGSGAFLAFTYTAVCVWEFAYTGNLLETPYYFSLFNAPLALVVGTVLSLASRPIALAALRTKALIVSASTVSVALPTFLLFRVELGVGGERAAAVTLLLMAASLLLLAIVRVTPMPRLPITVAALTFVLFTVGYSASSGVLMRTYFSTTASTFGERRETLSLATQLIRFMKDHELQVVPRGSPATTAAPGFWYDGRAEVAFTGMQSTYLWATTWVGLGMPRIDAEMRTLLRARRPHHLILLCVSQDCAGAEDALRRAGYPNAMVAERKLVSGKKRVWVKAVNLVNFKNDPLADYYAPRQSVFVPALAGYRMKRWSFEKGAPPGWTGAATRAARAAAGGPFPTTARQWDYELVGPKMTLRPGRYGVYASGRVLSGGLDLGVLDLDVNEWIEQRFYWSRQRGFNRLMSTPFTLVRKTTIQVVLSNWVPSDRQSSRWMIREIELTRIR